MADGQPELAFAHEQVDLLLVLRPLVAQHLDRDDLPGARVVAAVHAAEAAGRDLVQQPVAAEEVAVGVALEELVRLCHGVR